MFATEADAKEAYAGKNASPAKLKAVMRSASGVVRRIAPEPQIISDQYKDLASSAELLAGEYLWETGGYIKSDGVMQASTTFGDMAGVESAIRAIMGEYVRDEVPSSRSSSHTMEISSTFEPRREDWLPLP